MPSGQTAKNQRELGHSQVRNRAKSASGDARCENRRAESVSRHGRDQVFRWLAMSAARRRRLRPCALLVREGCEARPPSVKTKARIVSRRWPAIRGQPLPKSARRSFMSQATQVNVGFHSTTNPASHEDAFTARATPRRGRYHLSVAKAALAHMRPRGDAPTLARHAQR